MMFGFGHHRTIRPCTAARAEVELRVPVSLYAWHAETDGDTKFIFVRARRSPLPPIGENEHHVPTAGDMMFGFGHHGTISHARCQELRAADTRAPKPPALAP
jgi:hypothetical protein